LTLVWSLGVYARFIDEKINPAAAGAQSPARAWLEFADPAMSNPWKVGSAEYYRMCSL